MGTGASNAGWTLESGALEIIRKNGTGDMARLNYKDFSFRPPLRGARGKIQAIPKTKEIFLKTIYNYISKNNRKIINVETHEGFFRVWYIE